jgi:hypothetical protein
MSPGKATESTMKAKTFSGPNRVKVNDKATKWFASAKDLKQVGKLARFCPEGKGQWFITVRYEEPQS